MSLDSENAVTGNFILDSVPMNAFVDYVDIEEQTTTIMSGNEAIGNIIIPEALGASLSSVRFEGFDPDLLLINSVYKDSIFRKYYLFILKNDEWLRVVDGFILHVDNISEGMVPIQMDPTNSARMKRSYSVFDMDPESETKYTWILKQETTDILNR